MRYELIRLAQLVFALTLIVGAFLVGLAIGWWRWGRAETEAPAPVRETVPPPVPTSAYQVKADLFSPTETARAEGGPSSFGLGSVPPPPQLVGPRQDPTS